MQFTLGLPDVRVYTFGSPRVGNDVFATFFDNEIKVRTRKSLGCHGSMQESTPEPRHLVQLSVPSQAFVQLSRLVGPEGSKQPWQMSSYPAFTPPLRDWPSRVPRIWHLVVGSW